ncbi:NAF1-domain-containing protein [Aulographum hederae CBS 113979]|uniref:H/ACA ribonucleoprotein complex non-core subunit NAF1 n=1 Tax=Aulographum hederae CBS 113979 TaxID=1176131 RepID=A0A6G1GU67_9PEZI|nr:NAF1-domain-containing protein [Aulographum hederae CBS 113979]
MAADVLTLDSEAFLLPPSKRVCLGREERTTHSPDTENTSYPCFSANTAPPSIMSSYPGGIPGLGLLQPRNTDPQEEEVWRAEREPNETTLKPEDMKVDNTPSVDPSPQRSQNDIALQPSDQKELGGSGNCEVDDMIVEPQDIGRTEVQESHSPKAAAGLREQSPPDQEASNSVSPNQMVVETAPAAANTNVGPTELQQVEDSVEVARAEALPLASGTQPANQATNAEEPEQAEFRFDSSDEISSSDSSSDSSSSDDSEDEEGGMLLDPQTAVEMLMRENAEGTSGPLRTANEVEEEHFEKPAVAVTPEMAITELGTVDNVVGQLVLIKAKTSGDFQVLETGSVLCLSDRTVIGSVVETLGRVHQPFYSVGFSKSAEIPELGITSGTMIYYVNNHSTFVFTAAIKSFKGTDASNLNDEEIGADEIEFSDDDAEAEYKRNLKQAKQAAKEARNGPHANRRTKGPVQGDRPPPANYPSALSYDDGDGDAVDEDMYRPLQRPDNLHQMVGPGGPPLEDPTRINHSFGRRGRDDRGRARGRGGRGGRGGGRGQRPGFQGGNGNHHDRPYDLGTGGQFQESPSHNTGAGYNTNNSPQNPYNTQSPISTPSNYAQSPFLPNFPSFGQQGSPLGQYQHIPQNFHQQGLGNSANSLPPGNFLNPALFAALQQQSQHVSQQGAVPAPFQWPSPPAAQSSPVPFGSSVPPTSGQNGTASDAQDRLNELLRNLAGNGGR